MFSTKQATKPPPLTLPIPFLISRDLSVKFSERDAFRDEVRSLGRAVREANLSSHGNARLTLLGGMASELI